MCVVNHKHEYIFMHESHTGGRTVRDVLVNAHEGCEHFNGGHHISVENMVAEGHVTQAQFDSYYKFCFVRNPYEWLVTCWIATNRKQVPFGDFVVNHSVHRVKNGTLFWRYQPHVNRTFRYEHLKSDLTSFLRRIDPDCRVPTLPVHGKIHDKPCWSQLLTVSEAQALECLYPDVARYGYSIFK